MDRFQPGDELPRRATADHYFRSSSSAAGSEAHEQQRPVNVYDTGQVPLQQVTSSLAVHKGHSGHHRTREGLEDPDDSGYG